MKDISETLEYKGQVYKLVFNLNVLEEIQGEYGTFSKWLDYVMGDVKERKTGAVKTVIDKENGGTKQVEVGEPDIKAVKFAYFLMMNEGIEIENEETGGDKKPVTMKFVGRMFTELGLDEMVNRLEKLAAESNQGGEDSKNA